MTVTFLVGEQRAKQQQLRRESIFWAVRTSNECTRKTNSVRELVIVPRLMFETEKGNNRPGVSITFTLAKFSSPNQLPSTDLTWKVWEDKFVPSVKTLISSKPRSVLARELFPSPRKHHRDSEFQKATKIRGRQQSKEENRTATKKNKETDSQWKMKIQLTCRTKQNNANRCYKERRGRNEGPQSETKSIANLFHQKKKTQRKNSRKLLKMESIWIEERLQKEVWKKSKRTTRDLMMMGQEVWILEALCDKMATFDQHQDF